MQNWKTLVLKVLRILTPLDIERLTSISRAHRVPFKKVAGAEEYIADVTDEPTEGEVAAKVIPFRPAAAALEDLGVVSHAKLKAQEEQRIQDEKEQGPSALSFIINERERFRDQEDRLQKRDGLASYQRNSDLRLFRVTKKDSNGQEKTHITSTQGVLVNKKQA